MLKEPVLGQFIRSKKFVGVSYKLLKNQDRSYYIDFKLDKKFKRIQIGKKSEGINEAYCHQMRNDALNRFKFGDDSPIVRGKKKTVTLNSLADTYFAEKEGENKENGRQRSKYDLHIKSYLGQEDVLTLEQEDIRKFRNHLMTSPIKKRGSKTVPKKIDDAPRFYQPETVNGIIKLLSRIINYSIKYKKLKMVNPCIAIAKLKVDNARERFLSLDEIKQLIERVYEDREVYPFVLLSLITGGRESTIMSIKYKDINFDQSIVTLYDHKNNQTYTGFLDKTTETFLRHQFNSMHKNDYVIGGSNEMFPVRTIQNRLKKIFEELFNEGLDSKDAKNRAVIHTLRHTFASQLAIQGTPIFTIQKLMNHADIEQTMRYAKLAPDSGKEHVRHLYTT